MTSTNGRILARYQPQSSLLRISLVALEPSRVSRDGSRMDLDGSWLCTDEERACNFWLRRDGAMINISQPLLVHLSEKEQRESQEDGGKERGKKWKRWEGKRQSLGKCGIWWHEPLINEIWASMHSHVRACRCSSDCTQSVDGGVMQAHGVGCLCKCD